MTTIIVYDPAMCCSTGICGTDVDQRLVDSAADLDWLTAKGVRVQRFGLSRELAEFAANDTIRQIMQDSEGDDLPVFMIDGALKAKARYPDRAELAAWAGIDAPMMRLQDSNKTKILIVTLPETTPVLEAARLQEDLKRVGITPYGWVINASIAATGTTHPILAARAATAGAAIAKVRDGLAIRHAVVPMLPEDPVGAERPRAPVGRSMELA